jgi:hypothetical protein
VTVGAVGDRMSGGGELVGSGVAVGSGEAEAAGRLAKVGNNVTMGDAQAARKTHRTQVRMMRRNMAGL